jgi:hypothetical protein
MAYIGNQNYQAYVTLASQTFSVTSTTIYSLNYTVTNANNIALYINNVAQQPTTAYTASGNTLTLTTTTLTTDTMYAVYLGQGIQTVTPGATSVGTTQMNYPLGNFRSTGITDNASTTALTISSTAVALGTSVYVTNFKSTGITDSGTTTALTVDSSGNLKFNSGYGSVATGYACRVWVNFNGTGTVAIRGSGNVSSITQNSVGNFTVNFINSLTDVNYVVTGSLRSPAVATGGAIQPEGFSTNYLTFYSIDYNNTLTNFTQTHVAIFR